MDKDYSPHRIMVPFGAEVEFVCPWCVIDGRCLDGKTYSWSTAGEHEADCLCTCHSKPTPPGETK